MNPSRTAAVVLGAFVLQVSLLASFSYEGARADLMVLLPILAGFLAGPDRGAAVGFAAGMTFDLVLTTPFGLSALVYTMVGYGVGSVSGGIVRSAPWIVPAVAAVATAAGMLVHAVVGAVVGVATFAGPPLTAIVVFAAAVNAVASPLAVRALEWARADRRDRRRTSFAR